MEVPASNKKRILIADDDEEICNVLRILLEADYTVDVVHRGDHAWRFVQEHKPDFLITDLVMPRMDGLALCEAVRNDPALNHVRVLIITATTSDKELPDAVWQMASGADAFISKPFEAREVVDKIREIEERSGVG